MTYKIRQVVDTAFVTFTADGSQTGASNSDIVEFPTKLSSGGDNVSISAGGVLALDSARSYYIQAHMACDRPSSSSDISLEFWNNTTNTKLDRSDGAFEARYLPTSSVYYNGSTIGQLTLDNPTFDLSIKINQLSVGTTVDILSSCHLFIVEMQY